MFKHSCGDGMVVSSEGKGCVDRNECLDMPCLNGGTCIYITNIHLSRYGTIKVIFRRHKSRASFEISMRLP